MENLRKYLDNYLLKEIIAQPQSLQEVLRKIMITGDAAPQTDFGDQYIGGAKQWYINSLEDLIKCH